MMVDTQRSSDSEECVGCADLFHELGKDDGTVPDCGAEIMGVGILLEAERSPASHSSCGFRSNYKQGQCIQRSFS
jgi:hypothetical protein